MNELLLGVLAAFGGAVVGVKIHQRLAPETPNADALRREITAYEVVMQSTNEVVDDETKREITNRANERIEAYSLGEPVQITNSDIDGQGD